MHEKLQSMQKKASGCNLLALLLLKLIHNR